MQLSIIVPIYNVEKYLPRCIDSILAQTYRDFELILVDDGSPDGCGEIIDSYAKKDSRIIPMHQHNSGVSAARNAGLRAASGKYIGFVDPDDWIAPTFYEVIMMAMERNHAELGICNFGDTDSYDATDAHPKDNPMLVMDQKKTAEEMFHVPPTIYGSVANKVFVRDTISQEFDNSTRLCEDNLFLFYYILKINKAVWIKCPLYYVTNRSGSATRSGGTAFVASLFVREQMCEIAKKSNIKELYDAAFYQFYDNCIRTLVCQQKGSQERETVRRLSRKYLPAMMENRLIKKKTKIVFLYRAFRG